MPVLKVNIQKAIMRVFPVLLTLAIAVTAVFGGAVNASAVEAGNNSGWFDLLDFSTVTDTGNTFSLPEQSHLLMNMPFQSQVYYVDMLLNIEGDCDWISVDVLGDGFHHLTWVSLGNGLHRVYGALPAYLNDVFDFYIWHGGGSLRCTMLSLRLCTLKQESFPDVGTLTFAGQTVTQSAPNQVVQLTTNNAASFDVDITIPNWRKYDRIEVLLGCLTEHISSIFAYTDSYNLPVDVSYLDRAAGTAGMIYMVLSVDVSDIRDSVNEVLAIKIRGFSDSSVRVVSLNSVNGFVYVDSPSPLVYWFSSLFSKLGTWFNGVVNTVSAGFNNLKNWLENGFQSVVNKLDVFINGSQAQQDTADQIQGAVNDYNDQMQGVNRPDVNDDQFDVDTVIGADNLTLSISLFASLAQNEVASSMIVIVVIFMLGSYVLFGKKA